MNFNADSTSTITVNDSVADTDGRTVMNINKSGLTYTGLQLEGSEYVQHTYNITEAGGTYNFNDNVGIGTFNIFNGARVNFESYEHPNSGNPITTYGSLNVLNFSNDGNGGILNFINNHANNNSLGNAKPGSDIYVNIDLISSDLTTFSGDTFAINAASDSNGKINIDALKVFVMKRGKQFINMFLRLPTAVQQKNYSITEIG